MSILMRRWPAIFLVDVVLKFILLYGGAVLASLGTIILGGIEGVVYFSIFAAALATLNVMFLMVGQRVVSSLRCALIRSHPATRPPLAILYGLGMFAGAIAVLFSFGLGVAAGAEMGALFAVSNSVSIAVVLFFGCTFRFIVRALGR